MKIAGLQKTSLIDYPDQIATVIFTQGCNLRCPYCHNPELIPEPKQEEDYLVPEQIWSFLADRRELIDGVVITGGEPTLQSNLQSTLEQINQLGLKVKLDTNGSRPKTLKKLLTENLINYIAMDIKAPLNNYSQFNGQELTKTIKSSIELIKQSTVQYEFRTTVVPTIHDSEAVDKIGKLINGSNQHYIQNFRPKNTLNHEFLEIKEFPPSKLKEFKEILLDYVQEVSIRN